MFIDFLFCILLVMAAIKGFSKGLVVAVFSLVAFFVGLVAAMKLSAAVAVWLQHESGTRSTWMPFIAFVLVMAVVILLIRFGARLIEKAVRFAMMGWLNRIGGFLFYAIMYLLFFSIVLFFAKNLGVLSEETIGTSKTYNFVAPWGPRSIEMIGKLIPAFKGIFHQLEGFFDTAAHHIG